MPYAVSFVFAIIGNLLYFGAIVLPDSISIWTLLLARSLAGAGAANNTLGYSYIATSIPHDQQTSINVTLSMTRILGMSLGPFVNYAIAKVNTTISILGLLEVPVTSTNAVGLIVALGNFIVLIITLLFLEELPTKTKALSEREEAAKWYEVIQSVYCLEILLPLFIILVANCNFQLIETAFPPASAHALGWGPVQTSAVLGANAFLMFFWMMFVMFLSMKKWVSDTVMVGIGNAFWMVGGTFMYMFWVEDALEWQFIMPIFLGISGFPFIAASNRSNFTKAVASIPELETSQSIMQSVLSMVTSIAGFMTPTVIAAFVIRSPEDIDGSTDKHELTPLALYIPVVSGICIGGLCLAQNKESTRLAEIEKQERVETEIGRPSESTGLLPSSRPPRRRVSSDVEIDQAFSKHTEVCRRSSVEIMGVACPFDSHAEKVDRDNMWRQRCELHKLSTLDDDELDALALEEEDSGGGIA
jgi:hypothetical protein